MHTHDLSALGLFPGTVAVGWLDRDQPFNRGEVTQEFFCAMMRLLVDPWQPAVHAGVHRCQFCRFSGGPSRMRVDSTEVVVGNANLFVPGKGVLYVAPSLIAHYIDAHQYCPPHEFVDAVSQCPPMRSLEYLKQLKTVGGAALLKEMRQPRDVQVHEPSERK